jgi:hypothetical protein
MLVIGGIERVEPRQFRFTERRRFGGKPHQPFNQIVARIGIECWPDPGETLFGSDRLRLLFHLRRREAFEQCDIDPGLAVVVIEQFALDPAARGSIGVAANEARAGIAAPDSAGQDHSPDAVGIGGIVAGGHLLEDAGLDFLVRSCTEGFGNVEGDLPGRERLEHDGRKRRKTQTALDKADSQTEAAGNIFDGRTPGHERSEGLGFVGRVHGEAMEVLREASFDGGFRAVLEYEARDLMVAGEQLFFGEREHRATAAFAGFDLKFALRGGPDDEVLQQAAGCNAGLQLSIGCRIAVTADIAGRLNELVQRDRLDHGTHS